MTRLSHAVLLAAVQCISEVDCFAPAVAQQGRVSQSSRVRVSSCFQRPVFAGQCVEAAAASSGRGRAVLKMESDDASDSPAGGPKDWRAFRSALIARGIDTVQAPEENATNKQDAKGELTARGDSQGSPRKAVASANGELAGSAEALDTEYVEGVWAHEAGEAEVGGLLVRMPFEFQIVSLMRLAQRHAFGYGRGGMNGVELALGHKLLSRVIDDAGDDEDSDDKVNECCNNYAYGHRVAQSLVSEQLGSIIAAAGSSSTDPARIPAALVDAQKEYYRPLLQNHEYTRIEQHK